MIDPTKYCQDRATPYFSRLNCEADKRSCGTYLEDPLGVAGLSAIPVVGSVVAFGRLSALSFQKSYKMYEISAREPANTPTKQYAQSLAKRALFKGYGHCFIAIGCAILAAPVAHYLSSYIVHFPLLDQNEIFYLLYAGGGSIAMGSAIHAYTSYKYKNFEDANYMEQWILLGGKMRCLENSPPGQAVSSQHPGENEAFLNAISNN